MYEKDKKEKYQTIFSDWNHEQWRLLYKETLEDEECKKTRRGGIWCEDLSESTLLLAHDTLERQDLLRYKSLALVPFNLGSSEFSFIYLLDTRPGLFDDNEVNYLESIALILQKAHSLETPKKSKTNPEIENTSYAPLMGIMTTKENQVVDVNDWLLNFTGYSEEELQGRDFLTLIAVEYHETIQALLNQSDLVGEPLDSQEIEIIARDGRRRAVECAWQFYAMNGDSLDVWYFVSKEDKQWLQMQLLKSRKMESLGMLAGGIVHDFNNLLASILGYASLIQEEITKDSSYYEDVLQIQKTSEQGTELTSRLMAYTQGKEYIVNNLNINKLVTEVAGILSRTLDKKIIIRAELDDNLHLIYGDANQIQQSILQVALNARDAMPFGGKITFKTRNISVRESSVWTNQGAEPGEYVQVIISDSGKGIGSEIKDRIFEPHFTTKENETGRGLGLSMVKEIVDKHGGFISIFSEKNKGTMCKIQLRANIKPQQNKKKSPVTKPKLGKETILLIDEEKVLRDTARMMLTRYGYKVISTDTDKEAMSILQKYPSRIDLIIIDLLLKNINIKQTVDSFKKINPKIRVIASTSDVGTETMEGPVKESLAAVVNKPYQLRPLLSTIRSVLNA